MLDEMVARTLEISKNLSKKDGFCPKFVKDWEAADAEMESTDGPEGCSLSEAQEDCQQAEKKG